MPQVSIITPVYIDIPDKLIWLDEQLQSVLSQSLQDWEVILVDDFSPLSLGELKFKYQDEKRFRWFRTDRNNGPAKTRNTAAALAESEAILPLDSDDALATEVALERLYDMWQVDKTKLVYGNLQWLQVENNQFQRGKIHNLSPYTFKTAMDLRGVIPVTAMHSMSCHVAAGGWKAELEAGREDVEYIIAAGKAGFCGQKIDETTLLYRRHNTSRDYKLKHELRREAEMTQKIRTMHRDIFIEGRFPMGCCGQSSNVPENAVVTERVIAASDAPITKLPEGKYREDDLVWVEYIGGRKAQFTIFGRNRKESYVILRTGHKFQVHRDDVEDVFRKRSREYLVSIPNPTIETEKPIIKEVEVKPPNRFQGQTPQLATIERLDRQAAETRGIELEPEPNVVQMPIDTKLVGSYDLADLNLGKFQEMFEYENITVEWLAEAEINDLTGFSGIGNARAKTIIDKAKGLINAT